MTTQDTMKTHLAKKAGSEVGASTALATVKKAEDSIHDLLLKMGPEIARALPKHMSADRLGRIALTAIRNTPKLLECSRMSLLASIMTCAQLGLEPNTPLGQAYLIPRSLSRQVNGNWTKVWEVCFQVGYQGLLDLAYRSGQYSDIYAQEVYEGDRFAYKLGLNRDLVHEPCEDESKKGAMTHVYAVYHTKNGGFDFQVWPVAKILRHAENYSDSYKNKKSAWHANDASRLGMMKKTVLLALLKYGPKSIEQVVAITSDEKVKLDVNPDMGEVPAVEEADFRVSTTPHDPETGEVIEGEATEKAPQMPDPFDGDDAKMSET